MIALLLNLLNQKKKLQAVLFYRTLLRKSLKKVKVVAVGTGRVLDNGERVALEVSVGDRIIFSKYAGTEVKYRW